MRCAGGRRTPTAWPTGCCSGTAAGIAAALRRHATASRIAAYCAERHDALPCPPRPDAAHARARPGMGGRGDAAVRHVRPARPARPAAPARTARSAAAARRRTERRRRRHRSAPLAGGSGRWSPGQADGARACVQPSGGGLLRRAVRPRGSGRGRAGASISRQCCAASTQRISGAAVPRRGMAALPVGAPVADGPCRRRGRGDGRALLGRRGDPVPRGNPSRRRRCAAPVRSARSTSTASSSRTHSASRSPRPPATRALRALISARVPPGARHRPQRRGRAGPVPGARTARRRRRVRQPSRTSATGTGSWTCATTSSARSSRTCAAELAAHSGVDVDPSHRYAIRARSSDGPLPPVQLAVTVARPQRRRQRHPRPGADRHHRRRARTRRPGCTRSRRLLGGDTSCALAVGDGPADVPCSRAQRRAERPPTPRARSELPESPSPEGRTRPVCPTRSRNCSRTPRAAARPAGSPRPGAPTAAMLAVLALRENGVGGLAARTVRVAAATARVAVTTRW